MTAVRPPGLMCRDFRIRDTDSQGCRSVANFRRTAATVSRDQPGSILQQDTQHPAQRFRRAPQQLIPYGEGIEVF